MSSFVQEAVHALPRIVLTGREELIVENSAGICEFGENSITLRTSEGALLITGERLTILRAQQDSVALSGRISSVSYI